MRALIETRLSIEPDAAAFAADRATRAQLDNLRSIQRELESAADHAAAVDADGAFHHAIAEASGNLIYRLILDSLAELGKAGRLRSISRVGKAPALEQHAAILQAVRARDAKTARTRMREHVLAAVHDMGLPPVAAKQLPAV
jgi:DNA-binding FadR family transcriptional regulator